MKVNFFKGASLDDPRGLFNAGLDAKASRAIDIRESDKIDESALRALVRAAAALNGGSGAGATKAKTTAKTPAAKKRPKK